MRLFLQSRLFALMPFSGAGGTAIEMEGGSTVDPLEILKALAQVTTNADRDFANEMTTSFVASEVSGLQKI